VSGQAQSHVEMLVGSAQVHSSPFAVLYTFAGLIGDGLAPPAELVVIVEGGWYPVGSIELVDGVVGRVMLTAAQFMLNSCSRLYQVPIRFSIKGFSLKVLPFRGILTCEEVDAWNHVVWYGEWEVLSFGPVGRIAAWAIALVARRHSESLAVVDREANLTAATKVIADSCH